jgi:hypothetical protein
MQAEKSDFDFTKKWEDLSLDEKANFLSLINCKVLNSQSEPTVNYHRLKSDGFLLQRQCLQTLRT